MRRLAFEVSDHLHMCNGADKKPKHVCGHDCRLLSLVGSWCCKQTEYLAFFTETTSIGFFPRLKLTMPVGDELPLLLERTGWGPPPTSRRNKRGTALAFNPKPSLMNLLMAPEILPKSVEPPGFCVLMDVLSNVGLTFLNQAR